MPSVLLCVVASESCTLFQVIAPRAGSLSVSLLDDGFSEDRGECLVPARPIGDGLWEATVYGRLVGKFAGVHMVAARQESMHRAVLSQANDEPMRQRVCIELAPPRWHRVIPRRHGGIAEVAAKPRRTASLVGH